MKLKVYIYGEMTDMAVTDALMVAIEKECTVVDDANQADVALAPLLTRKLSKGELFAPKYGTLIFHPSLLPVHRGRDAIKWAYRLGDNYSGATWFWADDGLDTGDICEQEVLPLWGKPREFYENHALPAMARLLGYILDDLKRGRVRRRPQQELYATYEPPILKKGG